MPDLRLLADTYKQQFKWDSVEICYEALLKLDSTNVENLWGFADFLAEQKPARASYTLL
ncbi:MAG: hypothetical protein IPM82_11880 [Saprospiraceae bacterium]|nr:hypothetical protein [Saprospiraceae bacterium]